MLLFELESPFPIIPYNRYPNIGWWLDNDPVTFYHGTHESNLVSIAKNGLSAPSSGSTAGWISLALEPNTGAGYAAMSGSGGETNFRSAGAQAVNTPQNKRAILVIQLPQAYFLPKMAEQRGNVAEYRDKLSNKEKYLQWHAQGKSDQEYYAITEIRIPDHIDPKFIKGVMFRN